MTREELYCAMTQIDPKWIEEADPAKGGQPLYLKKRQRLRVSLGLAAAAALVLGLTALVPRLGFWRAGSSGADTTAAEYASGEVERSSAPMMALPSEAEDSKEDAAMDTAEAASAAGEAEAKQQALSDCGFWWEQTYYLPVWDAPQQIDAALTKIGTISSEEDAALWSSAPQLEGAAVFAVQDEQNVLYVALSDGYLRCEAQPDES